MRQILKIILVFSLILSAFPSFAVPAITYPYPVSYFNFQSQNQPVKMAFIDVKPEKANGKTVLLLHGKLFNARYWEGTIRFLSSHGYRVIVPEQIGFGLSSQPDHYQFSFQTLASNTHALLNYLDISNVIVIGHSMGGMLGIRFALMYPDQTKALVLEDPIGLEDWKLYIPYHSVDELYQLELKQTPESVKQYQIGNQYHGPWKPEYERWINKDILSRPDYKKIAWNQALLTDMIFTQPVLYEFNDLKIPTFIIVGQFDRTVIDKNWAPAAVRDQLGNYPKLAEKAAAQIPNARFTIIHDVSHIPHIERPETFYQILLSFISHA